MPKVLIADELSPRAVEILAARGIAAEVATGLGAAALQSRIGGYHGLAVRSATKVTAELLAAAPDLKVIGRAGIGVDNIDVAAASATSSSSGTSSPRSGRRQGRARSSSINSWRSPSRSVPVCSRCSPSPTTVP